MTLMDWWLWGEVGGLILLVPILCGRITADVVTKKGKKYMRNLLAIFILVLLSLLCLGFFWTALITAYAGLVICCCCLFCVSGDADRRLGYK